MIRLLPLLLLLACTGGREAAPQPERPNIVFILADDFGIVDTRAYAARFHGVPPDSMFYETPHLDRLIDRGVAFSQAYATQLCSPTRAGILSGKYAPRLGFTTAMPVRETYYNQGLPVPEGYYAHDVLDHRDKITIERAWDNATSNSALPTGAPPDNGRDLLSLPEALPDYESAFVGKWHIGGFGAAGYQPADHGFLPLAWMDGGGSAYYNWRPAWNRLGNPGPPTGEDYLTDDLTARAVDYLDARATRPDEPFFLYFCHFAVHSPYQGVEAEIDRYREKPTRGWNGHADPVYASMIEGLDRSVGAIMEKLEATGLDENTLVVFMSDNGGIDRKITPKGDGTDNRPFLGGKACLTEGGIRVPLVMWWKDRLEGGRWVDTPVDYTDLYPTIVAAAGYDASALIAREDLDGRPLIADGKLAVEEKEARYWHYPFNVIYNSPYDGLPLTPHSAVRRGDHKLIFDWHGRLHLYDLAADPYEENDLASTHPALRDELFADLMGWLKENVDARYWPRRNPEYAPGKEARDVPFTNLLGIN